MSQLKVMVWMAAVVLTTIGASGLLAGPMPGNGEPTSPDVNPPECCPGPAPAATSKPIFLMHGSVLESEVDLSVSGPSFTWDHKRTYSSKNTRSTGPNGYVQGYRWEAGRISEFLFTPSGGSDIAYGLAAPSHRKFTLNATIYTNPPDYRSELIHDPVDHAHKLKLVDSGRLVTFFEKGGTTYASQQQGLISRESNRYEVQETIYGFDPTAASSTGRITGGTIVTNEGGSQRVLYAIDFNHFGSHGYLDNIYVKLPSGGTIKHTEYTYYMKNSSSTEFHSDTAYLVHNGLIMARTVEKDSGGSLTVGKYTQYRHAGTNVDQKIDFVLESGAIDRAVTTGGTFTKGGSTQPIMTAEDLLYIPRTHVMDDGKTLEDYASRTFEYYNSNASTSSVTTSFVAGEDLETKYGGSGFHEGGFAQSETIRNAAACCGGSGGGGGVRKTYYYMTGAGGTATPSDVARIVVEDTEQSDGMGGYEGVYRTIYGLNRDGYKLREVIIENPGGTGTIRCWATSYVLGASTGGTATNDYNRVVEHRMPSAHVSIDTNTEIAAFLNPTSGTNDSDTLEDSTGLIYVYSHDSNGYHTEGKVKQGESGTAYFVAATDYGDGTSNQPVRLMTARYEYRTQTTTKSDGQKTMYEYTFWDGGTVAEQLQTITRTYPTVSGTENGSGVAIVEKEYYDQAGRMRWTKNGEGRVTYYAYHPDNGGMAYVMEDVKTDSLPSDITSGSAGKWIAWDDGSGGTSIPSGFEATFSDALQLVTKHEYDEVGRRNKSIDPNGKISYFAYHHRRTVTFDAWDESAKKPLLPIQVTETFSDGEVTSTYTVDPNHVLLTGGSLSPPIDLGGSVTQADYLTWTRYTHNHFGQVQFVDRYHTIPTSGTGDLDTNFHRTAYRYDDLGRRTHVIQVVGGTSTADGVEQVTKTTYDILGRVVQVERGVSDAGHDMTSDYDTDPTLATISETFYDETSPGSGSSGVGDGLVTSVREYFGTGPSDYKTVVYHYNWRNQLRGVEPDAAPYVVQDVDFMGRTTHVAQYTVNPTWATVVADADYADSVSTDRRSLSVTQFDVMGRVYRQEQHEIDASSGSKGDKLVTDSFYDRNSRLVATSSLGSGAREIAYDGAGRQYQTRVVTALTSTKYTSGVFDYRAPLPKVSLSGMSSGDDKVVQLSHTVFDSGDNVLESITLEAHHDDADGLNMSSDDDYIQSASYSWYDDADRVIATAFYGTGGTSNVWQYNTLTARGGTAPASSDSVLVTTYAYDAVTGRLEVVTDAKAVQTKTFYDDLGRVLFTIENYHNASLSGGTLINTGDGSDKSRDRATGYQYNGLSEVTHLTAYDANADGTQDDNQTTIYLYEDDYHASLVTNIIYPDSSDTTSSGTDQVKLAYNLDGSLAQRTSQKHAGETNATVIIYTYDTLRRPDIESVTTLGDNVDGEVRSMQRGYDALGRLEKVTSFGGTSATGTVRSEVQRVYDDLGALNREYQAHGGTVDTGSSPYVEYTYDDTASGGTFSKAYRLTHIRYPNGRLVHYTYGSADSIDDLLSRASGLAQDSDISPGTPGNVIAAYAYNGVRRMVHKAFSMPDLVLDYTGGTSAPGTYTGFDRFGRIASHAWVDHGGTVGVDVFRIGHGYDRASNRLHADRQVYTGHSQVYQYDSLHRLTQYKAGELKSDKSDTIPVWTVAGQKWTLDALGNQAEVANWTGGTTTGGSFTTWYQSTFNKANEITNRKARGDRSVYPVIGDDFNDSGTEQYWHLPSGSGDAFDIDTTTAGKIDFTTIARDTYDTHQEGGTLAFAYLRSEIGPGIATVDRPLVAVPSGIKPLIFGLQSANDYWSVRSDDGTVNHVVDGSETQVGTGTYSGFNSYRHFVGRRHSIEGIGNLTDGFPSGQIGTQAGDGMATAFDYLFYWPDYVHHDMAGRWNNHLPAFDMRHAINAGIDQLQFEYHATGLPTSFMIKPVLLRHLRVKDFEATFQFKGGTSSGSGAIHFVFNALNQDHYHTVLLNHQSGLALPANGTIHEDGKEYTIPGGTINFANAAFPSQHDTPVWVRVTQKGGTVAVKMSLTEGGLTAAGNCWTSVNFDDTGGFIGFAPHSYYSAGQMRIDDLTVKSDLDHNGTFETTEHVDSFTIDGSGYASDDPTHDARGNLTYDGELAYTYDAWNRLVAVRKAYSVGGTVFRGGTLVASQYDGLGRRITKSVINSAYLDGTTHFYHNNQQIIEQRNGSDMVIKHHVWGLQYIDELLMILTNDDLAGDPLMSDSPYYPGYYALHDANYNVIGLFDTGDGVFVERYEYTPYGERQVFISAGSNDPRLHSPTYLSQRVVVGATQQFYAINDVGHQGLMHDEETGLVYNWARMRHPRLGRWLQREPLGYVDGMSLYQYVGSQPIDWLDPTGEERFKDKRDRERAAENKKTPEQEARSKQEQEQKNQKKRDRAQGHRGNQTTQNKEKHSKADSHPSRKNAGGGRNKGIANTKALGAVAGVGAQAVCALRYNNCLDKAQQGLEQCYPICQGIRCPERGEVEACNDNCWYGWKLDAAMCATEYSACALTALLPFSF